MKKVIIEKTNVQVINLENIPKNHPIFAKNKDGKLAGMLIEEQQGWILRIGGGTGATGHHESRELCIRSCVVHGYEFFVED